MNFKKILALTLVMLLTVCLLCSCSSKAERTLERADKALAGKNFKMSYDFVFTYSDPYLQNICTVMNYTKGYMIVDGEKVFASTELEMPTSAGQLVNSINYTFINEYVYVYEKATVAGNGTSRKFKVFLTDEQKAELLGDPGRSFDLKASYFTDPIYEGKDENEIIRCYSFSEDFKESLKEMVDSALESISKEYTLDLTSARIDIILKDGEYSSAVIECSYDVTIGSKTYKMTMEMNISFETDGELSVSTPDKEMSYLTKEYDDVFGED